MAIKQVKVDVNELTIGMFVSKLDRPWTQTPFPLQGFYIRELDEVKELKTHCRFVYIDVLKGRGPVRTNLKNFKNKPSIQSIGPRAKPNTRAKVQVAPLRIRHNTYPTTQVLKKEVKKARQLHQQVFSAVAEVMDQLEDSNHVPIQDTKRVAGQMVDSVLRNPDAFTWLSRVKEKDEHTYSHAVRSAVWAILYGRHIGLVKGELNTLAVGVLLKDVGKTRIDKNLLMSGRRSSEDMRAYEKFVEYGVEILRETPGVEPRVISVVKTHCERLNGSGFPNHLQGDKIPLLGKIAGIVTFYDDVTNPRGQTHPLSPSKAVAKLYETRNIEFQEELVVEFIRAIGLYPTGTLVELNTGEVGVVVEQNFERRLKPKVVLVLDALKRKLRKPVLFDMAEDDKRKQELIDSGKKSVHEVERIEIAQDLEPSSFDIDIGHIRDHYLFNSEKKDLFSFFKNLTS